MITRASPIGNIRLRASRVSSVSSNDLRWQSYVPPRALVSPRNGLAGLTRQARPFPLLGEHALGEVHALLQLADVAPQPLDFLEHGLVGIQGPPEIFRRHDGRAAALNLGRNRPADG